MDIETLLDGKEFRYGNGPKGQSSVFFDADNFGRNELVRGFSFRGGVDEDQQALLDQFPISDASRKSLKNFYARRENLFEGKSEAEVDAILSGISYTGFLKKYGGLTDEAADLFVQTTHGYWGVGADSLSVAECVGASLPIMHLLGRSGTSGSGDSDPGGSVAMFPDGNASIARLLVSALIPSVAPGSNAANIAMARFDYSRLDDAAILYGFASTPPLLTLATRKGAPLFPIFATVSCWLKVKAYGARLLSRDHSTLVSGVTTGPEGSAEIPGEATITPDQRAAARQQGFRQAGISGAYCPRPPPWRHVAGEGA